MYAKIENGKPIFPPINDGNKINVDKDLNWLNENGFIDYDIEELNEIIKQNERNEAISQLTLNGVFTKLQIRRALRNMQLPNEKKEIFTTCNTYEDVLDTIIDNNESFKKEWNDAQDISINDAFMVSGFNSASILESEISSMIVNIYENSL